MSKLPKSLIKKYGISKKAWRIFKSKGSTNPKTKTKRRKTNLAKKKKKKSGGNLTQTAMKFARLSALLYPPVTRATNVWNAEKNIGRAISEGLGALSGHKDGQFNLMRLVDNWTPYVATSAISYGVGKLNGMIRRLKIG